MRKTSSTIQSLIFTLGLSLLAFVVFGIPAPVMDQRMGAGGANNSVGSTRYAVIDLGVGVQPIKITDSGYVLFDGAVVWNNGTSLSLAPWGASVCDIDESGDVLGTEQDANAGSLTTITIIGGYNDPFGGPYVPPGTNTTTLGAEQEAYWPAGSSTPSTSGVGSITTTSTNGSFQAYFFSQTVLSSYQPMALSGGSVYAQVSAVLFIDLPFSDLNWWHTVFGAATDLYINQTELGNTILAFSQWSPPGPGPYVPNWNGTLYNYQFVAANENGDVAWAETPDITANNVIYQLHNATVNFKPLSVANRMPALANRYFAAGYSGGSPVLWDSTNSAVTTALSSNFCGYINGAVTTVVLTNNATTNFPTPQMVLGNSLEEMDTNGVWGPVQNLDLMYDTNSGWTNFSTVGTRPITDYGAIVGTATYIPPTLPPGQSPPANQPTAGQHGVMLLPVQFALANPTSNDVLTGWDSATSSSDHTAWTICGLTGPDNTKVKLVLPQGAQNLGLECVVDDTDSGYSASCITLQPVTIQGGDNALDIKGVKQTNSNTANPDKVVSTPARVVLRVKSTKQVLLVLNVMVLPTVYTTIDMFFCYDGSSPAAQTATFPYPSNYQSMATGVLSDMNSYLNKESRVLFLKGTVGTIHASTSGIFTSDGSMDFDPGSDFASQTSTIGALISASWSSTLDPQSNDPNQNHLRLFVVKKFGPQLGNTGGITQFPTHYSVILASPGGTDHDPIWFNNDCIHETSHSLALATQNLSLPHTNPLYKHDGGPWPTAEFGTDAWGTPNQTGLMWTTLPNNYWIRHEDWQEANYYAGQNLQ